MRIITADRQKEAITMKTDVIYKVICSETIKSSEKITGKVIDTRVFETADIFAAERLYQQCKEELKAIYKAVPRASVGDSYYLCKGVRIEQIDPNDDEDCGFEICNADISIGIGRDKYSEDESELLKEIEWQTISQEEKLKKRLAHFKKELECCQDEWLTAETVIAKIKDLEMQLKN